MQKYFIPFFLGFALLIAAGYLLFTLNPYNVDALIESQAIQSDEELIGVIEELVAKGLVIDYLDMRSVSLTLGTGLLGIFSLAFGLHLIVDKLFIKKFYESPSIPVALRRASILLLTLLGTLVAKVYAGGWQYAIVWAGFMLTVELLMWKLFQKLPEADKAAEPTLFQKRVMGLHLSRENIRNWGTELMARINVKQRDNDK